MAFSLDFRAHSEVGLVRRNNQDSGYASPHMLVVADGMGGAAAGDLASTVAIREILKSDGPHQLESAREVLAGALARANHHLADLVQADNSLDGMGTTVCGGLFTGSHLSLVHIGDSRAYQLRAGTLHRLTHDHSWVQSLVDEGRIGPEEAATHPHRSLLLKVLNGQSHHEPDLDDVELALGDRLLFCSDGLCGFVDDATIRHIVSATDTLDETMDRLVRAAHAGGGADNITILLADVLEHSEGLAARQSTVVGAALDRSVPETEEHTLVGALSVHVDGVEPAATGERWVEGPDEVPALDPETSRYAPRTGRRVALLSTLAATMAFLLVAGGGFYGAWRWTRTQYFVGEEQQAVAIFRGIPGEVFGRNLAEPVARSGVALADLPVFFQQQVRDTIPVSSRQAADATVAQLRTRAEACRAQRTPTPAPTPTARPSASATTRATAAPSGAASARPASPRVATPAPSSSARPHATTPASASTLVGPVDAPSAAPSSSATPGAGQGC